MTMISCQPNRRQVAEAREGRDEGAKLLVARGLPGTGRLAFLGYCEVVTPWRLPQAPSDPRSPAYTAPRTAPRRAPR